MLVYKNEWTHVTCWRDRNRQDNNSAGIGKDSWKEATRSQYELKYWQCRFARWIQVCGFEILTHTCLQRFLGTFLTSFEYKGWKQSKVFANLVIVLRTKQNQRLYSLPKTWNVVDKEEKSWQIGDSFFRKIDWGSSEKGKETWIRRWFCLLVCRGNTDQKHTKWWLDLTRWDQSCIWLCS